MGDLLGGLIALLVMALLLPVILLVILMGLMMAGVGLAVGLFFTVLGIAIHLFVWAAPFLLVFGLIYLIFRPSPKRELARH